MQLKEREKVKVQQLTTYNGNLRHSGAGSSVGINSVTAHGSEDFNIHSWPLQPSSQDYGIASHTTHIVCVNFMRVWRDLELNDFERQIFEKLFHGRIIYSKKKYFLFIFRFAA